MPCVALCGLLVAALSGCSGLYFNALEQLGYAKRDLLVKRVKDARDSQEEAKEEFKSALEEFTVVLGFEGGTLEEKYEKLNAELERCERQAKDVRDRIAKVEEVSKALFREWEKELNDYTNDTLRADSEVKLEQTRERYSQLIQAMQRAEAKIDPVLQPLRDQVLFLKHNLNAQAIASLEGELGSIEEDVAVLIVEMEAAIAEADAFIQAMDADITELIPEDS